MEKPKSTKELARSLGLLRRKSKSCGQGTKHINRSGQPFQYIAVIDFESTCWKDQKFRTQEIIEFPAVLLNTSTGECESEFHYYVQPSEEPTLSDFCRQLTGITQAQVEDGIPLSLCLKKFCHWVEKMGREKNVLFNPTSDHTVKGTFLTWSDWDLSVCLQYECKRKQILKPAYLNSWIDLRAVYRKFYDRKPQGLNGALQDLGIQFSGREHSGVDDARNTAQLAWRMIRDGCILNVTKSMKETATDCNLTVKQTPLAVTPKPAQLNQLFKLPLSPAPHFRNPKQGTSTDDQSSPVGKQSKCVKMSKLPIQTNNTRSTELFKRPLSPAVNRGRPSRGVPAATGSPLSKQAKLTACTSPQVSNTGLMAQRTSTAQIFQRQDLIFSDEVSSNTTITRQSAVSGCNKAGLQSVSVNSWLGSRPVTANNKKPLKQVERFQDKENVGPCLSSTSTISSKNSAFKTPSPLFSRVSSLVQRKLGMVTPGSRPAQTPVSVGGATPPLCQCGKRSKRRFVQSPGPNQGRCFFSCPQGRRPSMVAPGKHTGCQFFKWESSLSGRPKQSADVPHRSTMSTGHLRKAVSRTAGCLNKGPQTDSRIQKRPSTVFLR